MNREKGYYWVKLNQDPYQSNWVPAYWYGPEMKTWLFDGKTFSGDIAVSVNETKIEEPA